MSEAPTREDLLANTAAMVALTAIFTRVADGQEKLVAAATAATEAKSASRGKAKDKEPAAGDTEAPKTEPKPEPKTETAPAPTTDDVKNAILGYAIQMPEALAKVVKENGGKLPADKKWTGQEKFLAAERLARMARTSEIIHKGCGFKEGKVPDGETPKQYTDVPADMREKVIKSIKAATENGNILNPADFKDDADEAPAASGADDDLF